MFKNIPYGKQNITQEDIDAVIETLKSTWLTQGPKIREFEESFARYVGAKYAVAVSHGTAALHLANMVLGTKPGKKVITTPITFSATANSVRFCGGDVVFVDINPENYLIDFNKVEDLLKKSNKGEFVGIIPVDLAGYPVDLEELKKIADKYDLWIIEDACHAPGGYFIDSKGVKQFCGNGNFAELSIFSFHPVKHIACGEGGMITTNNEDLYKRLLNLRTHGIQQDKTKWVENHGIWYYEMQELSYNYRLTDIASTLGLSQLKRAKENLERRREIAKKYDDVFEGTEIILPKITEKFFHAYHLYIIRHKERNELINYLHSNNIFAQVHYIPVHLMQYYKNLGWKHGDFPVAEKYYEECLSIPMYPSLTDEEQNFVIEKILQFK